MPPCRQSPGDVTLLFVEQSGAGTGLVSLHLAHSRFHHVTRRADVGHWTRHVIVREFSSHHGTWMDYDASLKGVLKSSRYIWWIMMVCVFPMVVKHGNEDGARLVDVLGPQFIKGEAESGRSGKPGMDIVPTSCHWWSLVSGLVKAQLNESQNKSWT